MCIFGFACKEHGCARYVLTVVGHGRVVEVEAAEELDACCLYVVLDHAVLPIWIFITHTVTSVGNWQCAPSCNALSQNSSTIINSSFAVKQSTSLTSLPLSGSGVLAPLPFSTPELMLSLSACWCREARWRATLALTRSVACILVLRRCAASCCEVKDQALNCVDVRYRSSSDSFIVVGCDVVVGQDGSGVLESLWSRASQGQF
jgi:hypothetical protein